MNGAHNLRDLTPRPGRMFKGFIQKAASPLGERPGTYRQAVRIDEDPVARALAAHSVQNEGQLHRQRQLADVHLGVVRRGQGRAFGGTARAQRSPREAPCRQNCRTSTVSPSTF